MSHHARNDFFIEDSQYTPLLALPSTASIALQLAAGWSLVPRPVMHLPDLHFFDPPQLAPSANGLLTHVVVPEGHESVVHALLSPQVFVVQLMPSILHVASELAVHLVSPALHIATGTHLPAVHALPVPQLLVAQPDASVAQVDSLSPSHFVCPG